MVRFTLFFVWRRIYIGCGRWPRGTDSDYPWYWPPSKSIAAEEVWQEQYFAPRGIRIMFAVLHGLGNNITRELSRQLSSEHSDLLFSSAQRDIITTKDQEKRVIPMPGNTTSWNTLPSSRLKWTLPYEISSTSKFTQGTVYSAAQNHPSTSATQRWSHLHRASEVLTGQHSTEWGWYRW